MLGSCARRVAMLVATLLVASFAIYGALYLAPGSPIAALTGGRTRASRGARAARGALPPQRAVPDALLDLAHRGAARRPRRVDPAARERLHADRPAHRGHAQPRAAHAADHHRRSGSASASLGALGRGLGRHRRPARLHGLGRAARRSPRPCILQFVFGVDARLVPGARHRRRLPRPAPAPDAARAGAGGDVGRARHAGDAHGGPRGARQGARADGGQPRPALARASCAGTCCATPRSRSPRSSASRSRA